MSVLPVLRHHGSMPLLRSAVALAAALALVAPTHAAADDAHGVPPARPHLLGHVGHGAAVVEALGDRLPEAAAANRMSPTKLRAILERDPSAWVGEDGQVFYVEPAEALGIAAANVAGAATATYPASQTFALHSLPGSTHTIFLDFDGATVSNTYWNSASGGM